MELTRTKTKIKNFMFDFDGTLIDSSRDVSRILIEAINKFGGNLSKDTKIKLGPPLIDMISIAAPHLSEETKQKVLVEYEKIYAKDKLEETKPFNGIKELLETLNAKNIKVFIVTYKPRELAIGLLDKYFGGLYLEMFTPSDIENFFPSKTKVDLLNLLISKWQANPKESVMVGDAKSDIMCAKQVGLSTIGAAYGYGEPLEFESADKTASSVKELNEYIKTLVEE
jgi:phosphoglycolate phosphatase